MLRVGHKQPQTLPRTPERAISCAPSVSRRIRHFLHAALILVLLPLPWLLAVLVLRRWVPVGYLLRSWAHWARYGASWLG